MLVTGGSDSTYLSSTEIYLNSQWSFAASLPTPREGLKASTVQNSVYVSGKFLIYFSLKLVCHVIFHDCKNNPVFDFTGGFGIFNGDWIDTILRYNFSTNTWKEVGQLTESKSYAASVSTSEGLEEMVKKDACI